jgi:hypothetical protein
MTKKYVFRWRDQVRTNLQTIPKEKEGKFVSGIQCLGSLFSVPWTTTATKCGFLLILVLCNFKLLFRLCMNTEPKKPMKSGEIWLFFLFFFIFFWRARVCRPLLRLCRPFMIFEGCLDSNPECSRSKLARYRLSHPSHNLATHPILSHPSHKLSHPSHT